jgi:hypothetical protein
VIGPRERFLKPGGRIMPVSLDVHLAPVNAPKLYHSIEVTPKKPSRRLGIDFSPLGELTVNNLYTCNLKAENLLGKPAKLLTCQFLSLRREDLTLDKTIRLDVNRGGAIHGLAGWFDARLSRTIRVSNGPDQPPSAWGQTFIPFRIPAKVVRGDRLEVRIRSSRWGQDSIWGWDVRIFAGSGNRRARKPKAEFHQSTFQGFPFSKERFEKRNPEFVPRLTPEGEAARFLLERVDGHRSLQKLGEELCKSFPGLCKDSEQGFRKVLDIVGDRLK